MAFSELCKQKCPVVANTYNELAHYRARRAELERLVNPLVGHYAVVCSEQTDLTPDQAISLGTEQAGRELQQTNELIARGEAFLVRLEEGCSRQRPVTLRAPVEGTMYSITACDSAGLPEELVPNEIYEPVTITRTPLQ